MGGALFKWGARGFLRKGPVTGYGGLESSLKVLKKSPKATFEPLDFHPRVD